MSQYTLFQPQNVLSISQLTSYLRQVLESDEILQDLWVQGEISNLGKPSSGHLYFTLKESDAAIRCVIWRNSAARLSFNPREGMAVEAHGGMSIYEVNGQVQLYIDTMKPAGEGALYAEYLRLKAKLEAEGLFDIERKRPIPEMPRIIGIVTSSTGAALQDMLNTLQRRYPLADVVLSPTAVQGADAPSMIVSALARLNQEIQPDVILIGRGGGSIEDLWVFNEEAVVRAVASSTAPIISGVGHETDVTLTDFAADLRAPTPTAAAEVATINKEELTTLRAKIADLRWEYGQLQNALERLSPAHQINTYRQRLDEVTHRLEKSTQTQLERKQLQLMNLQQALRGLNPKSVLNRGYAIVTHQKDGTLIKSAEQVHPDDHIHILVSRGSMDAQITQSNPGGS